MKKILIVILSVLAVITGTIFCIPMLYSCSHEREAKHKIELGNEIVAKIDSFVAENDTLPLTLNEIGVKDKGGEIYYKDAEYWYLQDGCGGYYLYFPSWDAETDIVYDSKEQEWIDGGVITHCD